MKHLKPYKIFESELPSTWFENNPDNYLVSNEEERERDRTDKNTYEFVASQNKNKNIRLKDVKWEDIELGEEKNNDKYILRFNLSYDGIKIMSISVYKSMKSRLDSGDDFNRIHISRDIKFDLIGLGLGYKCYKAVINKLGFARSSEYRTNVNSRKIWSHLIKDTDLYVVEVESNDGECDDGEDTMSKGFMVFTKKMSKNFIKQVLTNFKLDNNKIIVIDDKLTQLLGRPLCKELTK